MAIDSRCTRCGHGYEPHTESTRQCTVCVRYQSLVSNSRRQRYDGRRPGCDFTREQFAHWFAHQPRCCHYCGIDETDLIRLGLRTQVGLPLQRLGVDRVDTDGPYRLGSIVLCCFACNKARSNTFTAAEMAVVGTAIAQVWEQRLSCDNGNGDTVRQQ